MELIVLLEKNIKNLQEFIDKYVRRVTSNEGHKENGIWRREKRGCGAGVLSCRRCGKEEDAVF